MLKFSEPGVNLSMHLVFHIALWNTPVLLPNSIFPWLAKAGVNQCKLRTRHMLFMEKGESVKLFCTLAP